MASEQDAAFPFLQAYQRATFKAANDVGVVAVWSNRRRLLSWSRT